LLRKVPPAWGTMLPCQLLAPIVCWRVDFRAKMAQENLIKASRLPYTIVRATQFFEFVGATAQFSTEGATVRLPSALMQPIVSDDVAAALAIAEPLNNTVEVAGPEPIRMDELVRRFLSAIGDPRKVITDVHALYYEEDRGNR
jgi:uncharacterized protein YbjT (DUF2867 family)